MSYPMWNDEEEYMAMIEEEFYGKHVMSYEDFMYQQSKPKTKLEDDPDFHEYNKTRI